MKFGVKQILDYFNQENLDLNDVYNAISNKFDIFEEIKGLRSFKSGVSTIVYKKENKVICLSIDYAKVLYLKKCNYTPGFKFLRFAPYQHNNKTCFVMIYEMDLLSEVKDQDILYLLNSFQYYNEEEYEDILFDSDILINFDLIFNIGSKKYIQDCKIDLHEEQFLIDSFNNVVCIDPILSKNIYL